MKKYILVIFFIFSIVFTMLVGCTPITEPNEDMLELIYHINICEEAPSEEGQFKITFDAHKNKYIIKMYLVPPIIQRTDDPNYKEFRIPSEFLSYENGDPVVTSFLVIESKRFAFSATDPGTLNDLRIIPPINPDNPLKTKYILYYNQKDIELKIYDSVYNEEEKEYTYIELETEELEDNYSYTRLNNKK